MSLLGLLLDHADAAGQVRMPLERMAAEFELPAPRAEQALEALVRVEAVRRSDDGLVLVGRRPPVTGGLRLSAFLANVDAVLGDEDAEPQPAPPVRSPVLLADAPHPHRPARTNRRRSRPREPVLAALALTAVVLLATLGPPSTTATRLRTVEEVPSTTVAPVPQGRRAVPSNPWVSWPDPMAVPSNPWVSWPDPMADPAAGGGRVAGDGQGRARPGAPRRTGDDEGGGTELRAGERREAPATGEGAPPEGPEEPGAAPLGGGAPRRPAARPAPPVPPPPPPAPSCPTGAPTITVDAAEVRPAGRDVAPALGVPSPSLTEVRGRLGNPTAATVVVRAYEVVLGSGASTVTVPGPPGPVTLAAGQQHGWTVRTPATAAPQPSPVVQRARVVDWEWQSPDLARSCPS